MLNESKYIQNFYHEQCIQIRKQIRQMDMYFKDLYSKNPNNETLKQEQSLRQDVNFIVIGPNKSGKSALLKSMFFSLNSHLNIQLSTSQLPSTLIKRYDIKKNKKYNIEGLQKMKETDQKRTITAFEFEGKFHSNPNLPQKQLTQQQKSSKIFQKYSNALQIIDNKIFGCFKMSSLNNARSPIFTTDKPSEKGESSNSSINNITIRTVLIVLNVLAKIQFEELSCMKFFITDIREKGLKILVILTHIDKLNKMKENDKLLLIEERIEYLKKQLDIKDRDDFICIENYQDFNNSINSQSNSNSSHSHNPQKSTKQSANSLHTLPIQNIYHIDQKNFSHLAINSFNNGSIISNSKSQQLQRQQNPSYKTTQNIATQYLSKQPSFQKVKAKQNYQHSNSYHQGDNNSFAFKKVSEHKNSLLNNNLSATKYSSNNQSHQNSFILEIPQISSNKSSRNVNFQGDNFNLNQFGTEKSLQISTPQKNSKGAREDYGNNLQYSCQKTGYKQRSQNGFHYQNSNNPQSNSSNHKSHYLQNPQQPSHYSQNVLPPCPIKNNEQINYYSLKLLIKIIKQNQKYVGKQLKNRKMIKWFCG